MTPFHGGRKRRYLDMLSSHQHRVDKMAVTINVLVGAAVPEHLKKLDHKIAWVVSVNGAVKHFTNEEEAYAHVKLLLDIQLHKLLNPPAPEGGSSFSPNL
jgi:hypothetical protein